MIEQNKRPLRYLTAFLWVAACCLYLCFTLFYWNNSSACFSYFPRVKYINSFFGFFLNLRPSRSIASMRLYIGCAAFPMTVFLIFKATELAKAHLPQLCANKKLCRIYRCVCIGLILFAAVGMLTLTPFPYERKYALGRILRSINSTWLPRLLELWSAGYIHLVPLTFFSILVLLNRS